MTRKNISKDSAIKNLIQEMSISRSFYGVTFTGYLLGYLMGGMGVTLLIPLANGLFQKDYSFIFQNKIVIFLMQYFPFIEHLSNVQIFIVFACAIFVLTFSSLTLNYIVSLYIWNQKQMYSLRSTTFLLQKYMSLGTGFFINNKSSILRSRLESIPRDAVYFVELTQSTIQGLMEVMVVSVILLNINPRFALISFGFFIVSAGIFQYLKSFINRTTVNRAVANIQFNSVLQDILMRSSLITATSNQEKESQYFMDEYAKMTKKRFYFEQIQNLIYPFSILFQIVAVLAMVLLLGNTVLFNPVNSASAALVFIVLFHRGIIKTQNLVISYLQRIGTKNALLATMQNISDLKPATVSGTTHFDTIQIGIQCKNLSFLYEDTPILQDVSLTIPARKMTLITGKNGAGKSTLISLILRFYECPPNTLFIDSVDIHDFDIPSLRSKIAYVAQDVILFNGTILENMMYGYQKKITEKRLSEVIERVGLTEFFATLPEGLETNIGDGGLKFSGGQRQRIAIARALLCQPQIIIFDEATKSIDAQTDELIMNMLVSDFRDTTRIVVTHNVDHKKFADNVIVLENGTVRKDVS